MTQIIISSGTTSVSTVDSSNTNLVEGSGTLDVLNGGLISGLITASGAGRVIVSSGGTVLSATINSGGQLDVFGMASSTAVDSGGLQVIETGGTANTTISGGSLVLSSGGRRPWRHPDRRPATGPSRIRHHYVRYVWGPARVEIEGRPIGGQNLSWSIIV